MDVEELGALGRRKGVCPYYAARAAAACADIVLLPYSALLSQARTCIAVVNIHRPEALGRKLSMGTMDCH